MYKSSNLFFVDGTSLSKFWESIIRALILLMLFFIFYKIIKGFNESPNIKVGRIFIRNEIVSSFDYIKSIRSLKNNKDVSAVLLVIDSPGGAPGASQAIFNEIKLLSQEKPVVALTDNVCTSGAYYIAVAAHRIIAPPSALVGSIGVYLQVPNIKKLLDKYEIDFKIIQSGKYKTVGNIFKKNTENDFLYLQKISDETYRQFVKDVAISRRLDTKNDKVWANGKVFVASQAKKLGLIDNLGSISLAEDEIKKLIFEKMLNNIKVQSGKSKTNSQIKNVSKLENEIYNMPIKYIDMEKKESFLQKIFKNNFLNKLNIFSQSKYLELRT